MDAVTIDRGDAEPVDVTNSAGSSRGRSKTKNAAFLLVFALSATALLRSQYSTNSVGFDRFYIDRNTFSPQLMSVSDWVNGLPQAIDTRRAMIIEAVTSATAPSTKHAGRRTEAVTVEDADMAWEKSQNLLRQLRRRADDGNKGEAAPDDNILHRALEGLQGIFNANKKEGGQKQVVNSAKKGQNQKLDGMQGNRRLKATENEELLTPSHQGMEGLFFDIQSTVSSSPIAAAILTFCGIMFLIVSVAMASDDSRRLRRLANSPENITIVLDEEEAEIVEFYEKEMESGMMQSFPFLEDDSHADDCIHDCREDVDAEDQKRGHSSFIRRPSSDSSLTRHLSGEARVSQCDSYYSRVLQDITSFDELDDDLEDDGDSSSAECDEERQNEPQEGESSPRDMLAPPRDGVEKDETASEACLAVDQEQVRISTQEQPDNEDENSGCQSSPPSSGSSISSLTSEVYADCVSPPQQPREEGIISSTSTAPSTRKRRSVSFSPQVKVREIPRQVNSEKMSSSEKYLYLMLLTVAIVITFCSLLPTPHPSLSVPISDLTAGEMIQRADAILKSQWEVEL